MMTKSRGVEGVMVESTVLKKLDALPSPFSSATEIDIAVVSSVRRDTFCDKSRFRSKVELSVINCSLELVPFYL